MKFGLGSFEGSGPHGKYPGVEAASSLDATYKEVLREVSRARIICPYPPGANDFAHSALIIAKGDPVRWAISYLPEERSPSRTWEVEVWVTDKVVAEGLVMRHRNMIDPHDRGIYTDEDEKDLLNSLTPNDVSWVYTYFMNDNDRKAVQDRIFNRPLIPSGSAEWFSSIIAGALVYSYTQGGDYVWSIDNVPDCPTAPVGRRLPRQVPSKKFMRGKWRRQ